MKTLLWDFDGTLAIRDGAWTGALVEAANRRSPERQVTGEEIRPFLQTGFPWHAPDRSHPNQSPDEWWAAVRPVFCHAFAGIGFDTGLAAELAAQVRSVYLEEACWRIYDDVVPCLSSLQQAGWTHYVLSNHVPELPRIAEALGLAAFFEEIISSAQTGFEKPHPEAFRRILRRLPGDSEVWMIGDSLVADVQGAEGVGVPAVLVRSRQVGARYRCDSLADVAEILRRSR
ncbi:MAG: HAD family hydrolase [Planctomycetes bacterium]|jgi:putative hydrolase of the HAD superfamily|nr:HAD family hydrolase [Planctomycetota bacterium]